MCWNGNILTGSQIDVKPVTDYDQFVGKTMEFKVVKSMKPLKNAVVSHKALIESDIEAQRAEIIGKLEKGQVLEGTIKNITDFGAFLDLGGLDGLLYITDISWGRINHPSEVLKMDQKLNVVVLDFDDDKNASAWVWNNLPCIHGILYRKHWKKVRSWKGVPKWWILKIMGIPEIMPGVKVWYT